MTISDSRDAAHRHTLTPLALANRTPDMHTHESHGAPQGTHPKLTQLCDADHRRRNPTAAAVAAAVVVHDGTVTMPDPYARRDEFRSAIKAARAYLAGEPSPRAIRAAAKRLNAAITDAADTMAKEAAA